MYTYMYVFVVFIHVLHIYVLSVHTCINGRYEARVADARSECPVRKLIEPEMAQYPKSAWMTYALARGGPVPIWSSHLARAPRCLPCELKGEGFTPALLQGYLARKKPPSPWDHHRALGKVLLQGLRVGWFIMSEVPL